MLLQTSVAAATAVVGYDIATPSSLVEAPYPRSIQAIGLAGSAAALDTAVDIFVGQVKIATLYNSATGAPNRDAMFPVGQDVPAGATLRAIVTDAPATNPINLAVSFDR
tara:strand:- start:564 stop:890 length:327 start_codon:yes stop_codon:yes gene_type:complete